LHHGHARRWLTPDPESAESRPPDAENEKGRQNRLPPLLSTPKPPVTDRWFAVGRSAPRA
jgi:hypothetical protein